jgi:DNA phosphorothioation-dependent restriction protein DptG
MATPIKFTAEELEKITKLRDKNSIKTQEFGQLELESLRANEHWDNLVNEKKKLMEEYKQIQKEEKELVEELNKKYGAGVVNLDSGEFTPSN